MLNFDGDVKATTKNVITGKQLNEVRFKTAGNFLTAKDQMLHLRVDLHLF